MRTSSILKILGYVGAAAEAGVNSYEAWRVGRDLIDALMREGRDLKRVLSTAQGGSTIYYDLETFEIEPVSRRVLGLGQGAQLLVGVRPHTPLEVVGEPDSPRVPGVRERLDHRYHTLDGRTGDTFRGGFVEGIEDLQVLTAPRALG